MSTYKDTWYVKLLHGFPHLDFSFQETNSTFEPEKSNYQEVNIYFPKIVSINRQKVEKLLT